ncbi:MAG: sugar transferase [Anaerolineae bacterium]|nr:sugar transferase [Anaerolineae bacterium]
MLDSLNIRLGARFALADAFFIVLSLYISSVIRMSLDLGHEAMPEVFEIPRLLYIVTVIVWHTVFQTFNVYSLMYSKILTRSLRRMVQAHMMASLTFLGVLYIVYRDFSRIQSVYFIVLALVLMTIHRLYYFWGFTHVAPKRLHNVVIVGTDEHAKRIGSIVARITGLKLVGFVRHNDDYDPVLKSAEIIGHADELASLVSEHAIDEVIICDRSHDREYLHGISDQLSALPVNVRLSPDYSDLAYFLVGIENLEGMPLINLRYQVMTPWQRITKRAVDVFVALLVLVLSWPLFIGIAIAIKRDSPGPIFFRQQRVGERGKLFTIYKFRSMYVDAERQITYTPTYKQAEDPRVTRVGRFLRRTSLDELPQFLNVLMGHMSLVGPRPELPDIAAQYTASQRKRFEVPQGLTGWWQVSGRADLPMYHNTEYDLYYINNYSLWLDVRILLRTLSVVFRGTGAY